MGEPQETTRFHKAPGRGREGLTAMTVWVPTPLREEMRQVQAETGLSKDALVAGALTVFFRNRRDGFEVGNGGMAKLGQITDLLSVIAYRLENPVRKGRVARQRARERDFDPGSYQDGSPTEQRLHRLRLRRQAVREAAKKAARKPRPVPQGQQAP